MEKKMIISEEIFIAKEPTEIITLVGSSVAITIYDRVQKIGGLLHFLEPEWNGIGLRSCKYGNIGTEDIIKKFLSIGCEKQNLIANIVGGATIGEFGIDFLPIGIRNIQSAKKVLDKNDIAVDIVEVGKEVGRYLSFNSFSGEIKIRNNIAP
jgi:chemotaxis protein CheD